MQVLLLIVRATGLLILVFIRLVFAWSFFKISSRFKVFIFWINQLINNSIWYVVNLFLGLLFDRPPHSINITIETGREKFVEVLHASETSTKVVPYSNSRHIPPPLFTCEILNADEVYFEYKKTLNDGWSKNLPNFLNVSNQTIKSQADIEDIALQAFNYKQYRTSLDILKELNGYYRCVGNNTLGPYLTFSPVIKLVFPCEYLSLSDTHADLRFLNTQFKPCHTEVW